MSSAVEVDGLRRGFLGGGGRCGGGVAGFVCWGGHVKSGKWSVGIESAGFDEGVGKG